MEFLLQILPIIIYILLIIIIVIGIILGIKLIITIDKVDKLVNDVSSKVAEVTPIFDAFGLVSSKVGSIVTTVIGSVENLFCKLFLRSKEMESDEDE